MPLNSIQNKLNISFEDSPFPSSLIKTTSHLIKKDLGDFTPEDFRILIVQEMYLDIILPLSINLIEKKLLIQGDYYPGDLLKSMISINHKFWKSHLKLKNQLYNIVEKNKSKLLKVSEIKSSVNEFLENVR